MIEHHQLLDEEFDQHQTETDTDTSTSVEINSTTRFLSWSTLSFIQSPPNKFLLFPVVVIFLLSIAMIIISSVSKIEISARSAGELYILNTFSIQSPANGKLTSFFPATGETVLNKQNVGIVNKQNILATESGILVRKNFAVGDFVKSGDILAVFSPSEITWRVRSLISNEQLLMLKKGAAVRHYVDGTAFTGIGPIYGEVRDWHSSATSDQIILEASFEPTASQKKWLAENRAQLYNARVESRYLLGEEPALKQFINSLTHTSY